MSDDFTAQGRFDRTDERAVIPLNRATQGFGRWSKEDMWLRDIVSKEMVILVLTNERSWKEKDAAEGTDSFINYRRGQLRPELDIFYTGLDKDTAEYRVRLLELMEGHLSWGKVVRLMQEEQDCSMSEQHAEERFKEVDASVEQLHDAIYSIMSNSRTQRGKPETKNRGCSAMQLWALEGVRSRALEEFLQGGASLELTEKYGMTSLLLACEGGNPVFVQMLACRGCNMLAETPDGRNAVHIAIQFRWKELVQVLLDLGAPKCTIRGCMPCKLTMKLLAREQAKTAKKRHEPKESTPQAKQAAFERALAAFESEFGTFEQLADEFGGLSSKPAENMSLSK